MPVPSRGQIFGTPDGTRTHTRTDFKSVASTNWATGAYVGWEGGNRTPKLRIQSAMALPICLLPISPPDWN